MTIVRLTRGALLVLLAAGVPALLAQDQDVDTRAGEIYNTVMSPFCPGRTLATCPSPQAAQLRDEIRAKVAAGMARSEIVDELYATYGDVILATPRARGFGLLAWLVPAGFLLAGVVVLLRWLRSSRPEAEPVDEEQLDDDARRRLESELSNL